MEPPHIRAGLRGIKLFVAGLFQACATEASLTLSPVQPCFLILRTPNKQPLLSFKAGKMEVSDKGGDKFHITPDLRKGTISLFKGPDDQLMHFSWKERPSGTVVDVSLLASQVKVCKVSRWDGGKRLLYP